MWNCLPPEVTSAPSLATFHTQLKTFLFTESYPDIRLIWHFCVYALSIVDLSEFLKYLGHYKNSWLIDCWLIAYTVSQSFNCAVAVVSTIIGGWVISPSVFWTESHRLCHTSFGTATPTTDTQVFPVLPCLDAVVCYHCWRRGSMVRSSDFGWRTFPDLCVHPPSPITWITTHFSDPKGMEGWVGPVCWPIADTLPTKWSHVSHWSGLDQVKSASQRPTF